MAAVVSLQTKVAKNLTAAKSDWLSERRTYLGATDVGAILDLNPYVSAHDVWLDKKGLRDVPETIPMRAGTFMESFIAKEFQNETGIKVRTSKLYRHPKYPFLACNPDREITIEGHPALLECKNVGAWASKNFGQDGADQIPQHYLMQIMWQLVITGKKVVVLAALIDNRELRQFAYTLDPALSCIAHVFPQETVRQVFNYALHWWRKHMEQGEEPPLGGNESDTKWVGQERATYENGQLTNADERTDRECVLLGKAFRRLKRAEAAFEGHKNRIKAYMAQEQVSALESTVGLFTWKTNVKGVATFNTPFTSNKA